MDARDIRNRAFAEAENAANAEDLERVRIKYLGRKGELSQALRSLKDLPLEQKREEGPELQTLKRDLEELLNKRSGTLGKEWKGAKRLDLTVPPKKIARGHMHPLSQVERDIRRIFLSLNFSVAEGPELETEYYNFDALNIPAFHPAREMWDTFWVEKEGDETLLMRTHTSPMQVRYMESHKPPLQVIIPGRVSRYEATDQTHNIHFLNVEGLMVGKDVTLANFKFVIEEFFRRFFQGKKIEFRYRPSYFPFVEPGVEVDIKLKGKWLEVMGAGMVHPRVFEYAHYNPRDLQGFAFGIGAERLAMIKYNIPDIRLFYSGDLRFIKQF